MVKRIKYHGIYKHDDNEDYVFESNNRSWIIEVSTEIDISESATNIINGIIINGNKAWSCSHNGFELRLWGWSADANKGHFGRLGELNPYRTLPLYITEEIEAIYRNISINSRHYK